MTLALNHLLAVDRAKGAITVQTKKNEGMRRGWGVLRSFDNSVTWLTESTKTLLPFWVGASTLAKPTLQSVLRNTQLALPVRRAACPVRAGP